MCRRASRSRGPTLAEAIRYGRPLGREDWRRALAAAEIAFTSEVLGTGVNQWTSINGRQPHFWFVVMCRVQVKVGQIMEGAG